MRRIVELRFSDDTASRRARESLQPRAHADGSHLELATSTDGRTFVFVTAPDRDALVRWHDEVIGPWLAALELEGEVRTTDLALLNDQETLNLTDEQRFDAFVTSAVQRGKVWSLYKDRWARVEVDTGQEALPFWSTREAAAKCVAADWTHYRPRAVELDEFIAQWLSGMVEDEIVVVLEPRPGHAGVVGTALALLSALASV